VEHVYRHHTDYDLVWCVNGEQPASLLADLAALAGQLGLAADASQEAQVSALRDWFERHQHWLLVLDNVDDPQAVVELLPRSPTGQVVITSRTGVGWERLATVLSVDVLAPTDAAGLLLARAEETGPANEAAATTLAATLDGLPLALEQAGAYVAATGTVTLADYAELFATRAPELLTRGQPLGYQHTVATTWALALQRLRETEPPAVDLLTLTSLLAPDDLPLPLLATHHDQLPEPLTAAAGDPLALADAVAALRRYSLIRVVADGLYVHRLLQTVIRSGLGADAERAWAATAVRLIRAGFPSESDKLAAWPECQRLLPHALTAVGHGKRLDVESPARLWLLRRAATYLWNRGQYRQARRLQEQTVDASRRVLGDDHPDTLTSMNDLATIQADLADLKGARKLYEYILAARWRVLGDDHAATLQSMNSLAEAHHDLGDYRGAHNLHEQTLAAHRRVLGDDHPATLQSMNNLAATRAALGDYQGARELYEQTRDAYGRVLGYDHPATLQSMNDLAAIQADLGDHERAREPYEQTLAAHPRVLGDDHPATLNSMNNLAATLAALGDHQGAHDLHERTLDARRRVLGDDHPDTLQSMSNLAGTLAALGDLQGARDLHEQVLDARRRVLGDDHPNTLMSMNSLAGTLAALGDHQGARDLHEQVLDARRPVLGDDHPNTLMSMNSLAGTLAALGDHQGARDLHEQVLDARRPGAGRRPPQNPDLDEQPGDDPCRPRRPPTRPRAARAGPGRPPPKARRRPPQDPAVDEGPRCGSPGAWRAVAIARRSLPYFW
jgi:tetratricopeptide (TPR) repeat protein